MSSGDFVEILTLFIAIPFATVAFVMAAGMALYVYFDAEKRSKNRWLALGLAVVVTFYYWPIGFFAYIICTAVLDGRQRRFGVAS